MLIDSELISSILNEIRFQRTSDENFGIRISGHYIRLTSTLETEKVFFKYLKEHVQLQLESQRGVEVGFKFKEMCLEEIGTRLAAARAIPNTPIGLTLVEACMGPMQQLVLNQFHNPGQIKKANTEKKIKRLLNIPKIPGEVSTLIQFKEQPTFEKAYLFCGKIEEVTVKRILANEEVIHIGEDVPPAWRETAMRVFRRGPFQGSSFFLRLHFDPKVLYYHGISTIQIASQIQESIERVACLPSPQWDGIVDVFPDELSMVQINREEYEIFSSQTGEITRGRTIIDAAILPQVLKTVISGVSGIEGALVEEFKLINFIEDLKEGKMAINLDLVRSSDVDLGFIEQKIRATGAELIPKDYEEGVYELRLPNLTQEQLLDLDKAAFDAFYSKRKFELIDAYYNDPEVQTDAVVVDESKVKAWIKNEIFNKGTRYTRELLTPFRSLFSFVSSKMEGERWLYVRTVGTNMAALYSMKEVDPYKTYNDDIREMYSMLGLGAAKEIHFRELWSLISSAAFISPMHVELLADAQFVSGVPRGVKEPQPGAGPNAAASTDRPLERFKAFAFGGGYAESTASVSTAIMTGSRIQTGTGMVGAERSEELEKRFAFEQPEFVKLREESEGRGQISKKSIDDQLGSILGAEDDEDIFGVEEENEN